MARHVAPAPVLLAIIMTGVFSNMCYSSNTAAEMASAANSFLDALTPAQRAMALFDFKNPARQKLEFFPVSRVARKGVLFKELSDKQRGHARDLLQSGLSAKGLLKADAIMQLEDILHDLDESERFDSELYALAIFGQPSPTEHWAWRVEGHHISLNFTIVAGRMVAATPNFWGAHPAEVKHGNRQGLRVLAAEEDLAREFLHSLDKNQLATAIFRQTAYQEIVTGREITVAPLPPVGISASQLSQDQMKLLLRLIEEYLSGMTDALANQRMSKLRDAGLGEIRFGWAGSIERGEPHYYRVQGPTFILEYDNTQDNANHIHTVWRDFYGDYGRDLLREHHQAVKHYRYPNR